MRGNQRRKMTVRTPRVLLRFFCGESEVDQDDLEHACAMQMRGGPGSNHGNGRVVEQAWLPGVDCQIRQ